MFPTSTLLDLPPLQVARDLSNQWCDWVRGHTESDLPDVSPTPDAAFKWWIDEWALQVEHLQGRLRIPDDAFRGRLRDELRDASALFARQGWLDDPASYHQTPPPVDDLELTPMRLGGLTLERFAFTSGYEPHEDEPGRDRWMNYPVERAMGWILRHDDGPRPWLVVINGYRTGVISTDVAAFRVPHLHHELGLNIANITMPLHGPRRALGENSGARVFNSGAMNTVFTIAQGAWDIRRLLGWLRTDAGAETVGLSGISLGGYMVSLVSCLDDDLACVIGGVPESDLVRGLRRNFDVFLPPFYEQWGLSWAPLERVFTPVSPLAMDCLVPHDRRYIYAGLLDRWVRPGNVKTLWEHWDEPAIHWYKGSHLSFPFEPSVHRFVDDALREALPVETGAAA